MLLSGISRYFLLAAFRILEPLGYPINAGTTSTFVSNGAKTSGELRHCLSAFCTVCSTLTSALRKRLTGLARLPV